MSILATQQSHASCGTRPRQSVWQTLINIRALARQRRALKALDPHLLCDIRITQAQVQQETATPIWKAPEHWKNS